MFVHFIVKIVLMKLTFTNVVVGAELHTNMNFVMKYVHNLRNDDKIPIETSKLCNRKNALN